MLPGEGALSSYDTNPECQCTYRNPDVRPKLHAHLGKDWPAFCEGSRDTVVTLRGPGPGPGPGQMGPEHLLTRTDFWTESG